MIEDIIKSIRATLYERTSSPLFGSLATSWAIWNWRLFVVVFSNMSVQETFDYIDTVLYPDPLWRWLPLVGGPVLTALAFLYLFPFPAQWVFSFWGQRQRALKLIRQSIEDSTPLTIDESRAIRRQVIEIQTEYETQLAKRADEISRLKQIVTDEQTTRAELEKRLLQSKKLTNLTDSELQAIVAEQEPEVNAEIQSALLSKPYRLHFNPQRDRATGSKLMLFGPNGRILEGSNKNESAYRIEKGRLELLADSGTVHNRFRFDRDSGMFTTTNEPGTPAIKGQYMVPDAS